LSRVLISGGIGFVGAHLSRRILRDYQELIIVDNKSIGRPRPSIQDILDHPRCKFVHGSLTKSSLIDDLPPVQEIYHLAGVVGTKHLIHNGHKMIADNLIMTKNIIDYAARYDAKVVFASSNEVYHGVPRNVPVYENDQISFPSVIDERWAYAFSKYVCEQLFHHSSIDFAIGRLANVYGPDMRHSYVVKSFIERIQDSPSRLAVYSPKDTRPFTYVSDTVRGLIMLMETSSPQKVYNIGNHREVSILELAKKLVEISGQDIELIPQPQDSIERRQQSIQRAFSLGFRTFIPLEEGLLKTWDWYDTNSIN
jgi:nucleoside-diphosphate-sugar epimerase